MTEPVEGVQHREARRFVQFYLETRGRKWRNNSGNLVIFNSQFIKEHKLEKRFQGHSYDIVTQQEVIEIDDLKAHTKKSHIINDQIAERYIRENHPTYKFYRLLKEEIVDTKGHFKDDVYHYLRTNLF